ncbi:radiation-inducible immediate-early gene IEX-1 [Amia ocellicauda]|uniref:radiation-inducible immediate-early gene IEX-1 n=1 Tax=Amia ocellicauda TaxID=2972642 RepID=UPI003464BFF6
MYTRSNSLLLSISAEHSYAAHSYRPMARSTQPEIFTFERLPEPDRRRSSLHRNKRRTTRVLYPSKVRKYLPPPEKSLIKRWLVALCLVVCLQIYTEEPCAETAVVGEGSGEDLRFSELQLLPFLSAELKVPEMDSYAAGQQRLEESTADRVDSEDLNSTCPDWYNEVARMSVPSRQSGYVVALLYPVYHNL